jgi:hypothetical protein
MTYHFAGQYCFYMQQLALEYEWWLRLGVRVANA